MSSIDYKAMGERIRKKRNEMKLTQAELAEIVDVSISHIGEIERGTGVCSLAVLVKIIEALDLNLDLVVRGITPKNAEIALTEILEKMSKDNQELYLKICEGLAGNLK